MYIKLILGLLVVFLHGYLILYLLRYNWKDLLKRPYLVFCFGTGGTALIIFIMSLAGMSFHFLNSLMSMAVFMVLSLIGFSVRKSKKNAWSLFEGWPKIPGLPMNRWKKLLCVICISIIVIQIGSVFVTSGVIPEASWDGRARWAFKAKVFFTEKSLYIDYFKDSMYIGTHPYYPLLVPLEIFHLYLFIGGVNDGIVKILFAVYLLMLVVAFFDVVRRYCSLYYSLFFTAFLSTLSGFYITFNQSKHFKLADGSAYTCMADLPLAFYSLIAVILLLSYFKKRKFPILCAGSFVLFFCSFTKLEGFYYSIIFVLSLVILILFHDKKRAYLFIRPLLSIALIFAILILPWILFKTYYVNIAHSNFPSSISFSYILNKIHRLEFIIPRLVVECLNISRWHITWILFLTSLVYMVIKRKIKGEILYLLCVVFGFFCFYTIVYMLSSWSGKCDDVSCKVLINVTINRLLFSAAPIALLYSALSLRCAFSFFSPHDVRMSPIPDSSTRYKDLQSEDMGLP